jgi:Flp pilus assembly protein TadG
MRRRLSSQGGASAVEFALVLPLLIVITFGIIEFGIYLYNQQVITNASREGARAGIVAGSSRVTPTGASDSIDKVVEKYCLNNLVTFGAPNTPITMVAGYSDKAPFGTELTVRVTYDYSFLVIPNFIPAIDKIRTMRAVTVMRYE